jgi:hypothetical protein
VTRDPTAAPFGIGFRLRLLLQPAALGMLSTSTMAFPVDSRRGCMAVDLVLCFRRLYCEARKVIRGGCCSTLQRLFTEHQARYIRCTVEYSVADRSMKHSVNCMNFLSIVRGNISFSVAHSVQFQKRHDLDVDLLRRYAREFQ